ncbi:MAG: FUSC family protein [Rhodanobacter sp.]
MPSPSYSLRAHVVESLTRIKRPDVPWPVVVRNTAAVVLPLGVGMAMGHTAIGLGVGAGALNTMFADQPGPYRQRLRLLLLTALAAALASLTGFLIGGELLSMLAATVACGFLGGLLVVFGTDTARVGMTSMILLVVTASTPTSLTEAAGAAALIFCGGLLLASFSVLAWPLQRYLPERRALAGVYRGLADLTRQGTADETDVPAMSEAMNSLEYNLLGRDRAHGRAMEAFGVLLELAERIRLELMAMTELLGAGPVLPGLRDDAAGVLEAIAEALDSGDAPERAAGLLVALRAQATAALNAGEPDIRSLHVQSLAGELAAAVRNVDWAGSRGELRASAAEIRLPQILRSSAVWPTLRASLTPASAAFRHALRMAFCLSAALLLSRVLRLPHGYWLPMTVAIVLRADFAATFNIGLLRVLGTVLGLLITTALLFITPDQPWAHLALMALLCMGFRYLANVHYGIAVAALTGTVVILLSFEGVDPGAAVVDRVINTSMGCALALLAYVAWPTWERSHARGALGNMLDAYALYLASLAVPAGDARRDTRNAARAARINAQASIERMRGEPATPMTLLKLARNLLANGNRLARTAMTLEAMLKDVASVSAHSEFADFIGRCSSALQVLSTALHTHQPLAALPDLRATQRALLSQARADAGTSTVDLLVRISDRLIDNIETLAHVVRRGEQELPAKATAVRA